jgi:hypothetical protein
VARFLKLLVVAAILALAFVELPAQDKIGAGTFKGTYAGGAGSGDFHLTLKVDGKGGFTGEVGFTIMGEEVPGKFTTLKIDGGKIEMAYDFDLQGTKLTSAAVGTLSGKALGGTYKTSAEGTAVDEGTWKTTLQ